MKTLYILRHAKSSWDNPEIADFERPLSSFGLKAAPFIGETMHRNGLMPDAVFCSPALRARQTAILVKETAGIETTINYDERIYEASPIQLLRVISESPYSASSVLLIGHNPGLEGLIRVLTREAHDAPTASLAIIRLSIKEWIEISANSGVLESFIKPREELIKALGLRN